MNGFSVRLRGVVTAGTTRTASSIAPRSAPQPAAGGPPGFAGALLRRVAERWNPLPPARRSAPLTTADGATEGATRIAMGAAVGAAILAGVASAAAPPNDDCSGALPIGLGVVAYDNSAATDSTLPAPCLGMSRDVWYTFTAESAGTLTVTNCGEDPVGYDSVIAIYGGGSCDALIQLACNDGGGACGFDEAAASALVQVGQTYWIRFGSYGGLPGQTGTFVASLLPPPSNDICAGATPLALDTPLAGWTLGASNDFQVVGTFPGIGQASPANATGRDVVYSFTAPEEGLYSFRVTRCSGGNPVLYLAGACPDGGPPQNVLFVAGANRTTTGAFASEEIPCVAMTAGQQAFLIVDATSMIGSPFVVEATVCTPESEPNGAPALAGALVQGMEGTISPAGDVDFVSLGVVPANSRIFAVVDGVAAGGNDFDLRVTTTTDTLEYDDANNDVPFGGLSANVAGTPAPPFDAELFLRVSHFNAATQSEPWRLHAVVQPPLESAAEAMEPDDSPSQANYALGGYFRGSITSYSDVDYFVFTAFEGQVIHLGVDGDPLRDGTPINAAMALLDADGASLLAVNDAGSTSSVAITTGNLAAVTPSSPGEAIVLRAPATGTYRVRVTAAAAGDYLLSIAALPATSPDYCAAGSLACAGGEWADGISYIAGVELAGMASSSEAAVGCYESMVGMAPATLLRAVGDTISVSAGGAATGGACTVWCDWNFDGDFDDGGETFVLDGGPSRFSGAIVPPASALFGATRMRVRLFDATLDPEVGPCGDAAAGEVEDYTVVVVPAPAAPPNDDCANAIAIGVGTVGGSTANATGDGSASCDPGGPASRDVWYVYTAPAAGILSVDTCGSAIDTVLSVHDACGGAELACSDDCGGTPCGGTPGCVSLPIASGQTVRIRVSDKGGAPGAFTLAASLALANDQCDGAILVTVPSSTPGTTAGSGLDTGLPDCASVSPSPSNHNGNVGYSAGGVWYRLIGDGGTVIASTLEAGYDTRLHVFVGGCGAFSCVTANDDIDTTFRSKVSFQTVVGVEYHILVSGFSTATGPFVLEVSSIDTPTNDDCADAPALGIAGSISGTTAGATGAGFGPNSNLLATCATNAADPLFDVWYSWTAPCSATLTVATCGELDTLLSVHAACPTFVVGNQFAGACSDDAGPGCAPGSQLAFEAVEGETYLIRVAGAAGVEPGGPFTLTWSLPDADADDSPDCLDGCPLDPGKVAPGVCGCGVSDIDSDGDGTSDCLDLCPADPAKTAPGICGCGVSDVDSDLDGVADCNDGCPSDPRKIAPGQCGCGASDLDSDGDGTSDCVDGCPGDPGKLSPGVCGCGIADTDVDGDGSADCIDGCPTDPFKQSAGICGCGVADVDGDGDGTADCQDLCPADPDKILPGACGCGVPDVDIDLDGALDCVDGCPTDPDKVDPGICGCGTPDTDGDADSVPDCVDECPGLDDLQDCNGNGAPDGCDVLEGTSPDGNDNGVPDECECLADFDDSGSVDGADLGLLLAAWGQPGPSPADLNFDGVVNGADLGLLLAAWGGC